MSLCEWNPKTNKPATDPASPGDCENEAVLRVGCQLNNYHLCTDCAALPFFKRKTSRAPLRKEATNAP